jgi:hypothetical protein
VIILVLIHGTFVQILATQNRDLEQFLFYNSNQLANLKGYKKEV